MNDVPETLNFSQIYHGMIGRDFIEAFNGNFNICDEKFIYILGQMIYMVKSISSLKTASAEKTLSPSQVSRGSSLKVGDDGLITLSNTKSATSCNVLFDPIE